MCYVIIPNLRLLHLKQYAPVKDLSTLKLLTRLLRVKSRLFKQDEDNTGPDSASDSASTSGNAGPIL